MKYPTRIFFGVILTSLFSFGVSASAQVALPITLKCGLKAEKGPSFSMTTGTETVIECTLENADKAEVYSAMLLGKQTAEDGVSTSAVTSLAVGKDAISATLVFPAVFQPGTYQYTFSFVDTKTKKELAKEAVLTGTLRGVAQSSIKEIGTDKAVYQWGEALKLKVALDIPKGTDFDKLFLHAALVDTERKGCSVLMEKQKITEENGIFHLTLTENPSCTNTLVVTLRSGDTVVDEKVIALGVSEKKPVLQETPVVSSVTRWSAYLIGGLVLTMILILALFGYFIVKKRVRKY